MSTIAIVDYGMGNLRSASKAIERVSSGQRVVITYDADEIKRADRVVVPGVGAIRDCMAEINRMELDDVIRDCLKTKPVLGICVGMQMMLNRSEENRGVDTLGMIPGHVKFFGENLVDPKTSERLKVPHMGWNTVKHDDHPMWDGIAQDAWFYFVHSYCAQLDKPEQHESAKCFYGIDFTAAIAHENLFAVQFHPEKSQDNGLKLLENFSEWDGHS